MSRKNQTTTYIVWGMIVFGALSFLSAYLLRKHGLASSLLINLAASSIIVIVTIIFIEGMPKRHLESKWAGAKTVAQDDLEQFRNMLISYMVSPLGYVIDINDPNFDPDHQEESSQRILFGFVDDLIGKDMKSVVEAMSHDDWKRLEQNMRLVRTEFLDYFQLYQELMTPEALGKLLKLHKDFKQLFNTLGFVLVGGLFEASTSQAHKTLFINTMAQDLGNYLRGLHEYIVITRGARYS